MAKTKLDLLLEQKEALSNEQTEIMKKMEPAKGETEERELSEEDDARFDEITEELKSLASKIAKQEKYAEAKFRNALSKAPKHRSNETPEEKLSKDFNMLRAIRLKSEGRQLDGAELEMHQEAENEARASGLSFDGNGIGIPSSLINVRTDLTAGTAATAGNLVATNLGGFIPALTPRLQVQGLGATMMTGLTGNLDIPIGNAVSTAAWEGENDTTAETNPTTTKISLAPNRLAAFTDVSKQLVIQSENVSIQNWVNNELSGAIARAVDLAGINGAGSGDVPEGILQQVGIGSVAGGTNGLAPTRAHLVDLITEIAQDNADMGNMAFLTTPQIRGALQKTKTDAGSGIFVWGEQANSLLGYNAAVSTQVPSDLDKGTSTGVCHAIIFGDWSNLIIAQWGGVEILVNPYTKAKEGLIELVVNSYWDCEVKHPEGFSAMVDALVS